MPYSDFAITMHGGYCCGVKTIKGFHYPPDNLLPDLPKKPAIYTDSGGRTSSSDTNFFWEGAPSESYLARFDRYLDFLRRRRPQGLVEIYLIEGQKVNWEPIILQRGFKKDVTFPNSNSAGRMITRYFRVMDKDEPPVAKEKPLRQRVKVQTAS